MSGNGAQGTKFRISVCRKETKLNNSFKFKDESLDKYHIKSSNPNNVSESERKQKYGVNIKIVFDAKIAKQLLERDLIVKKDRHMRKLRMQMKYLRLLKINNKTKSYRKKQKPGLLKLCELINEEEIQECKGLNTGSYKRWSRPFNGSAILLKDQLPDLRKVHKDLNRCKRSLVEIEKLEEQKYDGNKRLKVIVNSVSVDH